VKICWDVLKKDFKTAVKRLAHAIGWAVVGGVGLIAAVAVFLAPGLLITKYTSFPHEATPFLSLLFWYLLLLFYPLLIAVPATVINRYTDVWSECGEHGSPAE